MLLMAVALACTVGILGRSKPLVLVIGARRFEPELLNASAQFLTRLFIAEALMLVKLSELRLENFIVHTVLFALYARREVWELLFCC